jgi:hypothetical protein
MLDATYLKAHGNACRLQEKEEGVLASLVA